VLKDEDMKIVCRQCGKEFMFTKAEQEFYKLHDFALPRRCPECRPAKLSQNGHIVCSQCGTKLEKETPAYCSVCMANLRLESELKTKQSQKAASAAHTKLLAIEAREAELAESLRQKDQLVAQLRQEIDSLSQDLDKAYQFRAVLGPLQETLNSMQERLESLEQSQNKIKERMLQLVEKIHEMYGNTSLLDIIKRSLKNYQRQNAWPK
jgi:DNA repair exonuclease SbcCD ATPase subunit